MQVEVYHRARQRRQRQGYGKNHRMKRYKDVTRAKAAGVTFTPKPLADFVARQISSLISHPVRGILRICDPAMGEGALLLSLLAELKSKKFVNLIIHGFETNPVLFATAQTQLRHHYPGFPLHLHLRDFLEAADLPEIGLFDVVIANPPYVRTQILGAAHAQRLAARFGLSGRVDLAHAFLAAISGVLPEDGVAGVILSNRFLSTRSGTASRHTLLKNAALKHVWDLGDTKLFSAAVLPAVVLMGKQEKAKTVPRFSSIYETTAPMERQASDALQALDHDGVVALPDGRRFRVTHGQLDSSAAVWRIKTARNDAWLARVMERTWGTFNDVGKIRVGIKTCADEIFIRSDWELLPKQEQPEPELLRPLTSHHIARSFKAHAVAPGRRVLYPHAVHNGERLALDLSAYPRAAAYLERHREILSSRSYLAQAGRRWYEVWVPQDPAAWQYPKLVFRDIARAPVSWIDLAGTVINGDCYWLTAAPARSELLWLAAAISNSPFIEEFYDHRFHNKLFAGRRRFMTQYVKDFPLPDPQTAIAQELISLVHVLHADPEQPAADDLVCRIDQLTKLAFGVAAGV